MGRNLPFMLNIYLICIRFEVCYEILSESTAQYSLCFLFLCFYFLFFLLFSFFDFFRSRDLSLRFSFDFILRFLLERDREDELEL